MRALVLSKYGPPANLSIKETEAPRLQHKSAQMLVRMHSAGLNAADTMIRSGQASLLSKDPFPAGICGMDFCGTVEEVGERVNGIRVGDIVYGQKSTCGSQAEYCIVDQANDQVVKKPDSVSREFASTIACAGLTALNALADKAKLEPGQRLLVLGGTGGVGGFGVQIGRILKASEVVTVCSGANEEYAKELGATSTIDYRTQDVKQVLQQRTGEPFDVVFDCVGGQEYFDATSHCLRRGGVFVTAVGASPFYRLQEKASFWGILRMMGIAMRQNMFGKTWYSIAGNAGQPGLERLNEWAASGQLLPLRMRKFPFSQAAAAHAAQDTGHTVGKNVIVVDEGEIEPL